MGLALLSLLWASQFPAVDLLVPAAVASPRPKVCAPSGRSWERTAAPSTKRACALLARGYSQLKLDPESSLKLSERARQLGRGPEAKLLEARSLLRRGEHAAAHERFSTLAAEPRLPQLLNSEVLRERAAAAQLSGSSGAAAAYRRLLPRLGFLPDQDRTSTLLEAALSIAETGRSAWPEARGHLARALLEDNHRGLREVALAAIALLDDTGKEAPFDAGAIQRILHKPNRLWLSRSSRLALLAVSAELEEPDEAQTAWEHYRRSTESPVFLPPAIASGE